MRPHIRLVLSDIRTGEASLGAIRASDAQYAFFLRKIARTGASKTTAAGNVGWIDNPVHRLRVKQNSTTPWYFHWGDIPAGTSCFY